MTDTQRLECRAVARARQVHVKAGTQAGAQVGGARRQVEFVLLSCHCDSGQAGLLTR